LSQQGHPLAYVSKALGPRNRSLSVYEKEYLAILMAVQQCRPYLQLGEFVIRTNHQSLTNLIEQRLHTDWQKKALTKLMGLRYRVHYKQGINNGAADALSQKPPDSSQVPFRLLRAKSFPHGITPCSIRNVLVIWSDNMSLKPFLLLQKS
jgi:hypothetical protein